MPRTLALLALALSACAGPRATGRSPALVGKPAALSARDLSGREVTIGPGDGTVRVIDFWATWCEPCRDLLPLLDRFARDYGDQGLSVYGVSFDEDRAQVDEFLRDVPIGFTVLWDKGGARLAERLDIQRLPTTLLVDRKGIVREVHLGYRPEEAGALEAEVRKLLAER
ncbi:MAG TPA: TlpA disulfide reductase family protein [Anaeromyxobacter sp.]|nr:TlpA disulfide reductase family protein [Anaeromyxobacter sp.]